MASKNRDEKRRRQERTAARKRRERVAYREKYREQNCTEKESAEHNRRLQSGMKRMGILVFAAFVWNLLAFTFLLLFVGLWSESVLLNVVLTVAFFGSVFMGMLVAAHYMNRCYYYTGLGVRPVVPLGLRVPVYFVDWSGRFWLDDVFEEMNKEEVFTRCSAKQIVMTNDPHSGEWMLPFFCSFFLLYFSWESAGDFWTPDAFAGLLLCPVLFIFAGFLYVYKRKKTFIIDREAKTITIPPVCCLGKSKVVPWQQVVVAYCPGFISNTGRKWGRVVQDYLSLTAKEDLPYGPSLGFRCDAPTQYRFARLICEYMQAEDIAELPDIEGFEDIIARIKTKEDL